MNKIMIGTVAILVIGAIYFLTQDMNSNTQVPIIQNKSVEQSNKKYLDFVYSDQNTNKESRITILVDGSLLGTKTINQVTPPKSGVPLDVYIGGDMGQTTYDSGKHTWSGFYTTYKTKNNLIVHTVGESDGGYIGESYLVEIPNKNRWLSISAGYEEYGPERDKEYKEYLQIRPLIESIQIVN